MLDYGSEDIGGIDDDAGEEQEPPPTGRWTATSSYDIYMVDTPKENNARMQQRIIPSISHQSRAIDAALNPATVNEIVKFQVHPMDPTKTTSIGAQLNPTIDAALRALLCENWDIFA